MAAKAVVHDADAGVAPWTNSQDPRTWTHSAIHQSLQGPDAAGGHQGGGPADPAPEVQQGRVRQDRRQHGHPGAAPRQGRGAAQEQAAREGARRRHAA